MSRRTLERNTLTEEMVKTVFAIYPQMFVDMNKAQRICELRLAGLTLQEIGSVVGLTKDRIAQYVNRVCRYYRVVTRHKEKGEN